ncbi:hypothetical protein HDU85_006159 [Gaertneriomyces sp. JEL0708]|nr:hypothetical protein HDU85_006159 [Gaertneriomyces sp. JEL0708]
MRCAILLTLATAAVSSALSLPKTWKSPFSHNDVEPELHLSPAKSHAPSTSDVHAWNIHTLEEFPNYRMRVKEELKLCDPNVKQYAGYIDVTGKRSEDKHFFFWFFESRHDPAKDPLVLWLNGGPGCSSMTGLFMELGPCRVNPGGNGTTVNDYSWNNQANVVFLDQPVNVGFSHSDGEQVSNTIDAAEDVYAFLQLFLTKYKKYAEAEFHVTGESYAGHYVPAIGAKIAQENEATKSLSIYKKTDKIEINLTGLAIGNGLTDPLVQYEYYADMAADTTYGPILDERDIAEMRSKYPTCRSLIESCYKSKSPFSCVPAAVYCNNAMIRPFQKTGLNIYDIRKKCDPSNPLCYSILTDIETYLNRPDVQQELGTDMEFQGCNQSINLKFLMAGDWMRPYVRALPPLLEMGIRVLIYAGDSDYICNWIGNKAWVTELEWDGSDGFQKAKDVKWTSKTTGREAGEVRHYKNFAYVRLYEAGHMVPYDQPEHSEEMINVWLKPKEHK